MSPLTGAERALARVLLARAFRDNPLNRAVIGHGDPEERLRANLHSMRSLLPVAQRHGCVLGARVAGGLAGVLVAAPPFAYPLPPPPLLERLRCLLGQGVGVARRWNRVFEALDGLHPEEPHWYLGTLGVAPEQQRRGVGTSLLASWLARVDRESAPAYLETDFAHNVAFYARAGFETLRETRVLGVPVWCMRRPAHAA